MNVERAGRSALPSVDRVMASAEAAALVTLHGRALVLDTVRDVLAGFRSADAAAGIADILERAATAVDTLMRSSQRPVFNLTGVVLHTNLGRALLPEEAIAATVAVMRNASNLEFDLATGARGERDDHIAGWLCRLTGAAAAAAVNNNAGAVLLALNTLAAGREVIVSRGELIEIGGSFRLPDIMQRAGCRLREVGTTNRTHLADFADAIGPDTGLILKAHTSNYTIQGFTATVPTPKLAELARSRGVPFVEDLGSGTLVDLAAYGLPHEPTARESLEQGADVVTFSGDKLLGGPQAGLVVGRKDLVRAIAKNPMKRALRLDKLRLAALEAVLKLYADPQRLPLRLPTLRHLCRREDEIAAAAERVLPHVARAVADIATAELLPCRSQIGSGALPLEVLPSRAIAITMKGKGSGSALERLALALRALPVPVVGRIAEGRLLLDLRCLEDEAGFIGQLGALRST